MKKDIINSSNIIHQDMLRRVEALCTAEEPPACTAACPLHVDARELCRLTALGDWAGAFKLYQKTVPFAGVVARTCGAPCQGPCKREQLGGAIEVRQLEQALCIAVGKPAPPPLFLSKKQQSAAIVGGSLRGMVAANDLARKGYKVTILEKADRLGGGLWEYPAEVLPEEILEAEIQSLLALKIQVEYGRDIPLQTPEAATELLREFDGAFIACASPLDALADPITQQVPGYDRLLAGRPESKLPGPLSTIDDAYAGRSAAATLERLFQSVHVLAGREKEGGYETSLFTSLNGIAPMPPVLAGDGAIYTKEEAMGEAGRCIGCACLECVKKCGFLKHYKGNPRKYVREVYNNLSIAMGTRYANGMINTCALCSQCEAICPNGLDMAKVFLAARQRMVETNKMPASAYEFALLDMRYSLSEAFYTAQNQPGVSSSRYVFFPGCQLAASEPVLVQKTYESLRSGLEGGVGLLLACCGIMARWAGEESLVKEAKEKIFSAWEQLGKPTIIVGCPTCGLMLAEQYGLPVKNVFEVMVAHNIPGELHENTPGNSMALHHACGARYDEATKLSAMEFARRCGVDIGTDEKAQWETSPCCGYGGLAPFVDNALANHVTETAIEQVTQGDDDAPIVTYCVNCRDRYLAKGKSAWHLLELFYPDYEGIRHAPPTWSARQENRARLKREMLHTLWNIPMEEEPTMQLYIDEALEQKLEETHILHSDIAAAIGRAEEACEKLTDPETGRFTTYSRPAHVTFWVEYTQEGEGFRVHNAYSHRMDFVVTDKLTESRSK